MKVIIKSTLEGVAPQVFTATSYEVAKALILDHLKETNVKDRDKMIDDVSRLTNLISIQKYLANSLLKYESLGMNQLKQSKKG